ncbi:hypothetical protein COL60_03315 [Bacillus pseudomycoides]|uniref:hypothetical protein n=1 Tax=Bacillus pseudomycoides TaxID=64104 RepID=UPI000BF9066B|nr:hypothetical protein [Bacillus pseudomycoides]PFZ13154.1 hypothetical protein COL60_03315 [Bacillus pseudomycoides]
MKAKKLVALALPIMLVAGVGCSKDNAEEKKTDSLEVSETGSQEVSKSKTEKEYKKEANSLLNDMEKQISVLTKIVDSDKPLEKKDTEYREKSKAMAEIIGKMRDLDPEYKYPDLQNKLREVIELVNSSISSTQNGFVGNDIKLVHDGRKPMTDATKLIGEVKKKLK